MFNEEVTLRLVGVVEMQKEVAHPWSGGVCD